MKQTKLESLIERTLDVISGFIISVLLMGYIITPLIKHDIISLDSTELIVFMFTFVSFWRGYFWRRFFNAGVHKVVHKFVRRCYNGTSKENHSQ